MFFFTCFAIESLSFVYKENEIKAYENFFVDLEKGKKEALILWSHKNDNDANITVFNETGFTMRLLEGDTTAFITGSHNFTISVSIDCKIHVWIFPKGTCLSGSLLYSTTSFMNNHFNVSHNYDSICIFFANHDPGMDFSFSIKGKSSSKVSMFSESTESTKSFPYKIINFQTRSHFFIQIQNITKSETVHMKYTLNEPEGIDIQCDHIQVPYFSNNVYSVHPSIFGENDMQCSQEEDHSDYFMYLIFLIVFVVIMIIIGLMFTCGCCKWTYYTVQFRKNIKDDQNEIKIDPNELLESSEEMEKVNEEEDKDEN